MTTTTEAPRYTHDCDCCKFLGHLGDADLYVHPGKGADEIHQTVIARYSSSGPDYRSGMGFAFGQDAELTEARQRAERAGYIQYPYETALHSLHRDNWAGCDEFLTKSGCQPLTRLVLDMETGEATYERFAEQAHAYIARKYEQFGQPSSAKQSHQYLEWFMQRLACVINLLYSAKNAQELHTWRWQQEERFQQEHFPCEAADDETNVPLAH